MGKKEEKKEELRRHKLAKQIVKMFGFFFGAYIFVIFLESLIFYNTLGLVKIAGINCDFKSEKSAKELLNKRWLEYQNSTVIVGTGKYPVKDLVTSFDVDKTYSEALLKQRLGYLTLRPIFRQEHSAVVEINTEAISKLLLNESEKNRVLPVNASIKFDGTSKIITEKNGKILLLANSREELARGLSNFDGNISLKTKTITPVITSKELENILAITEQIVGKEITLKSSRGDFVIDINTLKGWMKISNQEIGSDIRLPKYFSDKEDEYDYFDNAKIINWLENTVASKVNQVGINAELTIANGKATVFVPSQVGYTLDIADTLLKIKESALNEHKEIVLKIDADDPEVTEGSLNNLGITELISTGWSNFAGSPKNRIHNVKNGASKFNGILIKPDEEFSFVETLGAVDASTGYLPELVILDDKTVPEYGGGLCQVSSTAFRAALNAGLPIVERRAHAYPVTYYKPYGTDATIYIPSPDLKFKNDTGHYILIQTRVVGTRLYFDFYGTKVARTVKFSGNQNATGAVDLVENVTPYIYDYGLRGNNSFTALFYRHIYDSLGKLTDNDRFTSKYDSPDKYPH